MRFLLRYVERFLLELGEFHPIGAMMNMDGGMRSVAGYDGREFPPAADIMDIIRTSFVSDAKENKCEATALAYDVTITRPDSGNKEDAIAIELDHRNNYSVVMYFPYKVDGHELILQDASVHEGAYNVFNQPA